MESSHLPNSYEVVALGVGILSTALVKFGAWLERKVQDAEFRECQRVWTEEIRPEIEFIQDSWLSDPWSRRVLERTEDRYDSFVDVAQSIERMNRETQDYLARLGVREH